MTYYFCDVCHYCLEAESLPDCCPNCDKTEYIDHPAVRLATGKGILDWLRARNEDWE